jgi:hypothetical protein
MARIHWHTFNVISICRIFPGSRKQFLTFLSANIKLDSLLKGRDNNYKVQKSNISHSKLLKSGSLSKIRLIVYGNQQIESAKKQHWIPLFEQTCALNAPI